ncbi:MAG: hypothetical protein KAR80_06780 [Rhodospirillaceae bacterium]|nr:hypothetical protein [Rhodospirillaceae bacterium]
MFYRIFFTPTLAFALAFVGVFSVLFTPLDAGAQLPGEDSHIQLQFVMVPAKNSRGLTESRAITSIYTVKYAEDVPTFCQKAPRVRETLIAFFNKYPLTIGPDRRLQLEGVGAKLVPHINRSMGKVMVTEAILLEGSKRLAKGAMSRLPFATTQGCGRVLEEYEQRMKELLNAREK